MGFQHPAHPWDNDELRDFYRRDADAEDKALAHKASRQPRGTAAPSPTPQALTSSAPEGRDARLLLIDQLTDALEWAWPELRTRLYHALNEARYPERTPR